MPVNIDRNYLQRVVAVINNKGGVGKTTLCANMGGLLAENGWRVLIVDLDGQGNLGLDLGYGGGEDDDNGAALSKSLVFGDDPVPIKNVRPGLDVIPGGTVIEQITASLAQQIGRGADETLKARLSLATMLAKISSNYDLILLDCPPNDDVIQSIAVAAARYILIPAKAEKASRQGVTLTAKRLDRVLDINPDLDLLGVVIFGSATSEVRVRKKFEDEVVADLGGEPAVGSVFQSYVKHAGATAKAARDKGVLVHELDEQVRSSGKWYEALKLGQKYESPGPQSAGTVADSLFAVSQEFIARLTEKEQEAMQAKEAQVV
ncbi:ParA family protein [Frondihabitans sp. VKM Ac-2883]|uniref:ParA family protein n=1 Tax=Frondihabitans sp. VKM Ac-2883 TaxID=2783823 RepID=UPI00188A4EED|nr:ParA family protein [Frondihabitans sp. VKM Ac-2883]